MSNVGISYQQHAPGDRFDAIVVGSGVGGLACAAALARYGRKRVVVFERHGSIGGFSHPFTRPNYEWDVGVHYVGEAGERGAIRRVFDRLTDGSLRWAALPNVYDRIILGDRSYDFVAGTKHFVAKMTSYFPREGEAISKYVDLIRSVTRAGAGFYLDRAMPSAVSRIAGPLLRRRFLRYATRTTRDVLRELTSDEELIAVLTGQYGDYGLPPSRSSFAVHASVATHYLGGGWYPIGGGRTFARAFASVIEQSGGVLCHSAEVARVVVERGEAVGVAMADGRTFRAPLVISDAGVSNTFGRLLSEGDVPRSFREALRKGTPSSGYVGLYLGFRQTDAELGLTGTNHWLLPDTNHDANVARFAADPSSPLPAVFASFPSAKDPTFQERFPGRAAVNLITFCPWHHFERWHGTDGAKRDDAYAALKEGLTERLLERLFVQFPQLRGKIDHAEMTTPLSTRDVVGHPRGELYGLDHDPARYRLPIRAATPVRGLFLTGADLVSAGVAGALFGGVMAAGAVLGLKVVYDVLKPGSPARR